MTQILQLKFWFWSRCIYFIGCKCQKCRNVCHLDSVFHVFIFFHRLLVLLLIIIPPFPLFIPLIWSFVPCSLSSPLLGSPLLSSLSFQTMENQMEVWYKEVGLLQVQVATIPQQTQTKETVSERQTAVEARMVRLIEPLKERRRILLASKELHQVRRDLEDEIVSLVIGSWHVHACTHSADISICWFVRLILLWF